MASIIALWILVLFETTLLMLLLRSLGQLRQRGGFSTPVSQSFAAQGLSLGTQAPDFLATDYEGKAINLAETDGKWRVLAFISPGCPACEITLNALRNLWEEQRNVGVLVVGGADRKANQEYAAEHEARIPIWTASTKVVKELYLVQGVPFAYILDRNGIILAKGILNTQDHLQQLLEEAHAPVQVSQVS